MATTWSDLPPKPLQTKEKADGGFFSSEDYHGGASASVPFKWESEPGTPKLKFRKNTTALPPLTPPPAYFSASTKRPAVRKSSKPTLLDTIFPKCNSRKEYCHVPSSPLASSSFSSSLSSSSSSFTSFPSSRLYSVPSSPITNLKSHQRERKSTPRLSFDLRTDGEEQKYDKLPAIMALCFIRGVKISRFRDFFSSIFKVLLRN
ncbi:hypothetical protein FH972_011806 [Carpinus fangiana]|uniref:Uncharacterized protein n=1 Tax=Carpinus fangiana TaxID=176857 RepID=A0A660KYG8_9ROSI|nr:hypothetical protein FH972_011806 [Carpinus fangiana]